ncbi:ferritin-like domain-containing protein [Solimonas terrae]|uniref:Ferritin-like domain-containing protein n=1 Tax=Solimonas terrae TaxID=1396819 RepID=A0A6M2BV05_9GAMM|nr:ferritin-like domain-containing protein [Solimonas terrae]NGY06224.1 ferritin-like domain-containing protein [Solimonas terrae]
MDMRTRRAWHAALVETDPAEKCRRVAALGGNEVDDVDDDPRPVPGRPARPALIHPHDVPQRALGSVEGRAALLHAIAHIEFNAINLALDAGWRFAGLPTRYYADWLGVAQDEARHFAMLRARLQMLDFDYGDFAAHNGLWEAAEKTAHDALLRMALVPRVLEARGLDVTPGMIARLRKVGDLETVAILELILREEVRHVEIGTRWFRYLCAQRGLDAAATFRTLLIEHGVRLRPPLNLPARHAAGFVDAELATT